MCIREDKTRCDRNNSDWNQDELQNVVEFMLQIEDFLADVDTEETRPSKFQLENAVTTLCGNALVI